MSSTLRVGLFVVGAFLVFSVGIFMIGNRDFRFTSTYRLNSDFKSVAGLDDGATVRVGGMHQGTVRKIILPSRPDQMIRVEMDMNPATRNVIKKDSFAAIRTEGMVGDQYVEISFGSPDAASVKNGDSIRSEPPLEIANMMKKANIILDGAQDAMKQVDQTAANLSAITGNLNKGKGSAGAFLNNPDVYQHIDAATQNLADDTEAIKHNFFLRGFFKKRGYEDQSELKQHEISKVPDQPPAEQFEFPGKKLFDKPDGAKIKDGKMLDRAGHYLQDGEHGPVVIAAAADGKGDSDKQQKNTEARAAVVRDYLVKHFKLDDKQITTIGLGKSQEAPDGGQVAILVYPEGTRVPAK